MLDFFKSKCELTLDTYFKAETICEKQFLGIANNIAKHTDDLDFICLLANFYLQGDFLYEAQEYYNIAKEKGCTGIEEKLDEIRKRIEKLEAEAEQYYYDSDDYYDPYDEYTREDSLMDALDGEMDLYWNID